MRQPLTERYRPATWQEVIGQDKVISRLLELRNRAGLSGRAYWLSGQSGTGKTTIARLIALDCADEFCIQEMDASALTVAAVRECERASSIRGWGVGGHAFIVNEAHGLRKDVIRQLLCTLERIPGGAVWLFTTTTDGQEALFEDCDDASPLLSRCLRLDLARRDLAKPFAERVREIAEREGMNGKPLESYVKLLQKCRNNFRAALQAVESGEF